MFVNYLGYKIEIPAAIAERTQYVATNHDGYVWVYVHKPRAQFEAEINVTESGKWVSPSGLLHCVVVAQFPVADNWRDTLRKVSDLQIIGE